jgi:hypothetical protein
VGVLPVGSGRVLRVCWVGLDGESMEWLLIDAGDVRV